MLRGRSLWPFAVVPVMLLTGCGGSKPIQFTLADRGRVVTLGLGRRAVVRLDEPDWGFDPVSGRAVRAVGPWRLVLQVKGCRALTGCGYVALPVQAVAPGRSTIVAGRGICGEDYRCPPSQRLWSMTIAVR